MRRKSFMAILIAVSVLLISCSEEIEDPAADGKTGALEITTDIASSTLRAAKVAGQTLSSFPEGSKLALFVRKDGDINSKYNADNYVYGTLTAGDWIINPAVFLNANAATVFGFYPGNDNLGNGKNIRLEHNSQTDYMYGTNMTGHPVVNYQNPKLKLAMNHALSCLEFRIKKSNYAGEGKLTHISVSNVNVPGATSLQSECWIDISTGAISYAYANGASDPAVIEDAEGLCLIGDEYPANEKEFMQVLVVPLRVTLQERTVYISMVIDGKGYSFAVAGGIRWHSGHKYTYRIELIDGKLNIEDVIINPWISSDSGDVAIGQTIFPAN